MKITMGQVDQAAQIVEVTFVYNNVTHERPVNAVFVDGVYDRDATAARVAEVAKGVARKISLGVIKNVEPVVVQGMLPLFGDTE